MISGDAILVGAGLAAAALYCGRRLWQVREILRAAPENKWLDLDR